MYNGKRILSEHWINESLKQGQDFMPIWGLLWWRLPAYEKRIIDDEIWNSWQEAKVNESFIKKMKPIKDKLFKTKFDYYNTLEKILGKQWFKVLNQELPMNVKASKRIYSDVIVAYYADGYRGNYLVIIPDKKIIAVRCADNDGFNYKTDSFVDFVDLISKLGK